MYTIFLLLPLATPGTLISVHTVQQPNLPHILALLVFIAATLKNLRSLHHCSIYSSS